MNDNDTTTTSTATAPKPKRTKPAKPKAAKKAAPARKAGEPKPGSKRGKIAAMIRSARGCTAAECAKAVGWDSVSVPMHARRLGIKKLRKEKTRSGEVRYFGK
jgi:transcriptional regulator with GAF, ATPase, and Fis domain